MRVLFAALALSILSFAAGIAGDLSIAAPPAPSVIVHLPPPIAPPADAIRAHPLAPLATATAAAAPARPAIGRLRTFHSRAHLSLEAPVTRVKVQTIQVIEVVKVDPDRAPKDDSPESAQI